VNSLDSGQVSVTGPCDRVNEISVYVQNAFNFVII
jgi:hypothetical protein